MHPRGKKLVSIMAGLMAAAFLTASACFPNPRVPAIDVNFKAVVTSPQGERRAMFQIANHSGQQIRLQSGWINGTPMSCEVVGQDFQAGITGFVPLKLRSEERGDLHFDFYFSRSFTFAEELVYSLGEILDLWGIQLTGWTSTNPRYWTVYVQVRADQINP